MEYKKNAYEKWSRVLVRLGLTAPFIIFGICYLTSALVERGIIEQIVFSNEIGPIGDFLAGTMVPFLTLAAFFLLYGSYKLQKEEMQASSTALQEQAASLQKQIKIMQIQNSQKVFFDLLELLEKNREIIFEDYFDTKERNYFRYIQTMFLRNHINFEDENCLEILKDKSKIMYERVKYSVGEEPHKYFNALTGVLKFIEVSNLDPENSNLFEIAFHSGITLPEKRFLIMYANSDFPFKDDYIINGLRKLKVLKWNK